MELLTAIFAVFTAFGEWIGDAVISLLPMFYTAESGLTFLGTLGVCGLGMSVIFLILGFIQNFLHFRG